MLNSLSVDRDYGWVGEEVRCPSTAVGTAHWLGAGWHIRRLNVDHLMTVLLFGQQQQDVDFILLYLQCCSKSTPEKWIISHI